MCKSKDGLVREVVGEPEPMAFLATDRQLKDIELYCATVGSFSILGVDATFNLGDFSVTPTTYRPLKIYNVRTGKPPVFLGPLLVHQSKEPTFYDWFVGHVSDTIITSMLKPLRQKAGLGDSLYSINDNEAENHLLKLKTEHKRVSLVTFIAKATSL